MDLALTAEHVALRDTVANFVAKTTPQHRFSEIFDVPAGPQTDRLVCAQFAEMGLLGLSVPEALGGGGASLVEETILFEELGAGLMPVPVFSTVAFCLPLLTAASDAGEWVPYVVEGARRYALAMASRHSTSLLGTDGEPPDANLQISGSPRAPELTGERSWILDAAGADGYLVPVHTANGLAVYLADAGDAVRLTPMPTVDTSWPTFGITFTHAPARLLLDPGRAPAALAAVRRIAALLASAEAVGISRQMLSATVKHASTRTQFGQPIATYQAVSHQLADTYVDLELARSLVMWAALEFTDEAGLAVAIQALPSAVRACERAIQLHGGIGMTWDAVIHRYYKRALLLRALVPQPAVLRGALAHCLLDP